MTWDLQFAPLLPFPLLIGAMAAVVVLVLAGLILKARGMWLRTPFLAGLILVLMNPVLREEDRAPIPDVLTVVVDESRSQDIGDRKEEADAILEALQERVARMEGLELRIIRTGSEDDEGTYLFSALQTAAADLPADRLAGAILITDGQIHDVPESGRPAGFPAPVHSLLTGARDVGDRKLTVLTAPAFGIVGKTVTVRVRVDDLGSEPGAGPATATLSGRLDGQELGARPIPVGEPVDLNLGINHSGSNVLELSVDAGPEELTMLNNRMALAISGVRDRLKVLLVSGEPHMGQRTWRDLLKSDPAVDLIHFTILRSPDKQDYTSQDELALIEFPTQELFAEKLNEFDLVIFDRFKRRGVLQLAYLSNVARYVEQGGALLVATGPAFATNASIYQSGLSAVLPAVPTGEVIEEPYKPGVTTAGARHPVTADLAEPGQQGQTGDAQTGDAQAVSEEDTPDTAEPQWGRWFRLIDAEVKRGTVVMTGPGERPLMVLDRTGEGRIALLLSDHIWLWSRGFEGGGPQQELLRRAAHWLMREPELEEEVLRATSRGRAIEITRRSMEETVGPVLVTTPDGNEIEVALESDGPGIWRGRLETDEIGLFRLQSGTLTAVAAVGPLNSREFADVRPSSVPLKPVEAGTGGGVFWAAENGPEAVNLPGIRRVRVGRETAGQGWLGLVDHQRFEVRSSRDVPLAPPALLVAMLLGLLIFAWRWEAR